MALARRLGATLCLVHVAPPAGRANGGLPPSMVPAYRALAALVARCAAADCRAARANLRLGVPEVEILAEAAEIAADLIVVGRCDGEAAGQGPPATWACGSPTTPRARCWSCRATTARRGVPRQPTMRGARRGHHPVVSSRLRRRA